MTILNRTDFPKPELENRNVTLLRIFLALLQGYVRDRLVQFAADVRLARRLGVTSDVLRQAVVDTLEEGSYNEGSEGDGPPRLQLHFYHDCLYVLCLHLAQRANILAGRMAVLACSSTFF